MQPETNFSCCCEYFQCNYLFIFLLILAGNTLIILIYSNHLAVGFTIKRNAQIRLFQEEFWLTFIATIRNILAVDSTVFYW